jgi:nicotinate-nucleotide adenylyltransferase
VITGVFGGSFDPPHVGHAIVAQHARERLGLDRVLIVPAGSPPHKLGRRLAPADVRLQMVRALWGSDRAFQVDDRELSREGPSFTVDTLRQLAREGESGDLVLLMGIDQFREFDTWHEPGEILRLARLAVLDRGPATGEVETDPAAAPHTRVRVPRIDVSSSEVRERVATGRSIRYLVPEDVRRIIEREALYRPAAVATGRVERDRASC